MGYYAHAHIHTKHTYTNTHIHIHRDRNQRDRDKTEIRETEIRQKLLVCLLEKSTYEYYTANFMFNGKTLGLLPRDLEAKFYCFGAMLY